MPFLARCPHEIAAEISCDEIFCDADFASAWLHYAEVRRPTYMQGVSFRGLLMQNTPYNEDFGIEDTRPEGESKEWELFDLEEDPLKLFNCYHGPKYNDVVEHMTRVLEDKMEEIGNEPAHSRQTWSCNS
ncbi:uncharacterized protein N7477_000587 [Penicillium maclennaniae]|uniref:uncharacterized protein n=1 Tax=Penicillium maclennaniae TaxID=1343394 RepID=UPI002540E3D5|nr:uncharacterized protein N7477_000587 [Penicillium maclennaniae]KAJ5684242.1 hypothetical protein N7477_000587 [Penicillium maclennaniae]